MHRRSFVLGLPLAGLASCSAQSVWAPDNEVARAMYQGQGPKSLTLYTMKNVESESGAHTALLVDASQRVMFDPAGTFGHPTIPERNDVHFGFSPRIEAFYASYHARETFYVIAQHIEVSPEVAEMALGLVLSNGPVAKAHCTKATSAIIGRLPGFEQVGTTYFPNNLFDDIAKLPNVTTTVYRENDADDKAIAAEEIDAAIRAGQ
jgi:hypothetical protein